MLPTGNVGSMKSTQTPGHSQEEWRRLQACAAW